MFICQHKIYWIPIHKYLSETDMLWFVQKTMPSAVVFGQFGEPCFISGNIITFSKFCFFFIYDSAESQISLTNWSLLCPVMPHSEIQKKCAWKKKGFHHNHRFPSFLSRQKKCNCTKQKDNFCVRVVGGEAEALSTQRMNVHTDQNYRRMANKCCLVHTVEKYEWILSQQLFFFIKNIPHIMY